MSIPLNDYNDLGSLKMIILFMSIERCMLIFNVCDINSSLYSTYEYAMYVYTNVRVYQCMCIPMCVII